MAEDITLKERLTQKLEAGEIDQKEYDELLEKFSSLDLLSSKVKSTEDNKERKEHKVISVGFVNLSSEIIDGPVKVSGRLITKGPLKCEIMSISGSASIAGELSVTDATKVSGKLSINGDGKFGGPVKISGKLNIDGNIFCTDNISISGKIITTGDMVLGGKSSISGKLSASNIRSTALFNATGKISIENDILAKEFVFKGDDSTVGGNLQADNIEISKQIIDNINLKELEKNAEELDSIPALGSFLSKLITSFIPTIIKNGGRNSSPGEFAVYKDIRGKKIDISYTHVKGNIVGEDITIGPNVIVEGEIQYVNTISVPEVHDYKIVQIDAEVNEL